MRMIKAVGLLSLLAACTPADDKLMDYCMGLSEASESVVIMRDDGLEREAALGLLTRSKIAEDKVLLAHMRRNIEFAYRYPKMPLDIYKKEVFNHCLATD